MSEMHERLRQARINAGFKSAADAAARFGWAAPAYRHHENGTSGFKRDRALEYANAFDVPVEWLLFGADDGDRPSGPAARSLEAVKAVPVLGEVAAGLWREIREPDMDEPPREYLNIVMAGLEGIRLYALKVVGPSMNLVYPEGRYVICADPEDAGVRNRDHVVVRRSRAGLYETTIKELVREDDDNFVLWPRSSDPEYQTPLRVHRGDESNQDGPEIVGVVIADYAKRNRPPE